MKLNFNLRNILLVMTVLITPGIGFYNAQAQSTEKEESQEPMSQECLDLAKNPDADVGVVIRAGCKPTLEQMAKLMDNPLGNVAMLFTQFDSYKMRNPTNGTKANQHVYTGIAQFPKKLNDNWNLINRVVWAVPSVPLDQDKIDAFNDGVSTIQGNFIPPNSQLAPINAFDGRTTSFGDLYYVGLFAPSVGKDVLNGKLVSGIGFDLAFPTASDDITGSGKYSAGPSALAAYLGPKWKVGGLLQHYWDYSGDSDRAGVNFSNLQYLYYYSLNSTTSIGAAPNILVNWDEDSNNKVTLPVGVGINKTVNIGKVPVRFGVEAFYSAIKPDDIVGSDYSLRFYMIPALPSALFSWMQ